MIRPQTDPLAAMLQLGAGGGGGPQADASAAGLDPSQGGAPAGPGGGQPGVAEDPDFERLIRQAADLLHQAAGIKGEDEQDRQLAADCFSKLQSLFATKQKEQDAAMGVTPVHKGVRRAVRQAGGAGGGSGY